MILRQCPVTGGQTLRVTRNTWEILCSQSISFAKEASGRGTKTAVNTYCWDECRGEIIPAGLTITTLEEMMEQKKCTACGKVVAIKAKGLCAKCLRQRADKPGDNTVILSPPRGGNSKPTPPSCEEAIPNPPPSCVTQARGILGVTHLNGRDEETALIDGCHAVVAAVRDCERIISKQAEEIYQMQAAEMSTYPEGSMAGRINQVCTEVRDLLISKNKSYGNSAADPIRIFSHADPVEQINVRIDDKLSRLMRGTEHPGDDTVLDLIGYLILRRVISPPAPSL